MVATPPQDIGLLLLYLLGILVFVATPPQDIGLLLLYLLGILVFVATPPQDIINAVHAITSAGYHDLVVQVSLLPRPFPHPVFAI